MRTERLYREDSFLKECEAKVLDCREEKGVWLVELDRTILFPEGGGQPSDMGTIDDARVTYARETEDCILHHCDRPVPVGKTVSVRLDFERRFDLMQQHTGEHMLSSAAYQLFGCNNVGFHLTDKTLFIDLDQPLTPEQVTACETRANLWCSQQIPVQARYLTREEYEAMPMRKKAKDIVGDIRLISIPGVDDCTCCGTHCATTAQVGEIKVLGTDHYKGGIRIEFACGGRALEDHRKKTALVSELCVRFSSKPEDLSRRITKLEEENQSLKLRLKALNQQILAELEPRLLKEAEQAGSWRLADHVLEGMGPDEARELMSRLLKEDHVSALLWVPVGERLFYFFGISAKDGPGMRAWAKRAGVLLNGRGGGSEQLVQGSCVPEGNWQSARETLHRELAAVLAES